MKVKQFYLKTKKIAGFFIKPILDRVRLKTLRSRTRYAYYYKYCRVEDTTILYESFFGRGLVCNPYALFRELFNNPKYKNYKHVWVLDNLKEHLHEVEEYKKYKNVKFIQYNSRDYLKYLSKSKYLINNTTFPSFFTKKSNQVYINTWHGIPLKKLGIDMTEGRLDNTNVFRNLLHTDYIISANNFLTDIFLRGCQLRGLYSGKIIEEGYPRNDITIITERDYIYNKLNKYGVKVDESKKVILYAPTWKGNNISKPIYNLEEIIDFKNILEENIDCNIYQVFIKPHQAVYNKFKNELDVDFIIPAMIDANEILSITDILISDYSSIYFDFLITNRPVLFYIPDVEEYKLYRGLYFSLDDLPGPYTKELCDIYNWINNIDYVFEINKEKYLKVRNWTFPYYGSDVSKRVIDVVFDHNEDKYNILSSNNKKMKVLFHRGLMKTNGISATFLNLLNLIDYTQFDVTAHIIYPTSEEIKDLSMNINSNVRLMTRNSTLNLTIFEDIRDRVVKYWGIKNKFFKFIFPEKVYQREFLRCYGNVNFDYVFDFEGYNIFFSLLHLQSKSAIKGIWLHSDMMAEKNLRFSYLKALFTLYSKFDKIVSCSYDIMLVNRENLATDETRDKFVYVKNAIDPTRAEEASSFNNIVNYDGNKFCAIKKKSLNDEISIDLIPLDFIKDKIEYQNKQFLIKKQVKNENGKISLDLLDPLPKSDITHFITIGRLSPEKNHQAMIMAFSRLFKENYNIMLYIVGDGPLLAKTKALIKKLKLDNHIILTGNVQNPFELMKHCDCFILPSLHEGQPVVLNEARLLKMPIIVSNFSSVNGATVENGQLVIGKSEEDIYNGMKSFIEGKVPKDYIFDCTEYNKEAYNEFLNILDLENISK